MQFAINKKELLTALTKVQGIFSRDSRSQIYSHIRLEAIGTTLTVTSICSEGISMVVSMEDSILSEDDGAVCVHGNRLLGIARVLREGSSVISVDMGSSGLAPQMMIQNGRSNFKIMECRPIQDFPPVDEIVSKSNIVVDSNGLKRILGETKFSIGKRPHLNGIHVEIFEKDLKQSLRVVSSDGSRLSWSQTAILEGGIEDSVHTLLKTSLISERSIQEIFKVCEKGDADTSTIGFGDNGIRVQNGGTVITSTMISGNFPAYQRIFDSLQLPNRAQLNRLETLEVCKRVSAVSIGDNLSLNMRFQTDEVFFSLGKKDGELLLEDRLDADYIGEKMEFSFSAKFFEETMNALDSDFVLIHLGSHIDSACLISIPEWDDCQFVIMPMKMN